jgi:hypothetical protein
MKDKSNSKFSFIYLTVLVLSLFAVVFMLCILQEKIRENLRLFEKNPVKQKFYSMRNNKPNCNQIDQKFYCFNRGRCLTKKILDEWKTFCICKKVKKKKLYLVK